MKFSELTQNSDFYKNADVRPPFTYASLIRQVNYIIYLFYEDFLIRRGFQISQTLFPTLELFRFLRTQIIQINFEFLWLKFKTIRVQILELLIFYNK